MTSTLALDFPLVLAVPARVSGVHPLPSGEAISDQELVARAQGGDAWAEEKLYRRHVRYVFGLAARLLRNSIEAEDVVQDTFAIALEQMRSLRDGAALRGWLAQIAVSQARRRLRRRRLLRVLGLDSSADDATLEALAEPSAGPEVQAELAVLDRLLDKLPGEQRLAWMLRYVEGESLEDVARVAGCSLATAKRRIASADARVRLHVHVREPVEGARSRSPAEVRADVKAGLRGGSPEDETP
jgi:RNA polymerase sigma-70 factor (ECF subfamily)